jgi:indole-3-glycerol phosphate synthase
MGIFQNLNCWRKDMPDYLEILTQDAKKTINEDYYKVSSHLSPINLSLKKAIIERKNNAIITEIKPSSPSLGIIKTNFDLAQVAIDMKNGGAVGISVLTEPKHFNGSLENLQKARETVRIPILMKDIILDPIQLEAASRAGANVVLLIEAIFDRDYSEFSLEDMIKKAHLKNLEVLVETHSQDEFNHAIQTDADLVGINNRNLGTLKIDLQITEEILKKNIIKDKIIVSESGIKTKFDLLFLKKCGAQAFLIGSSIMMAKNIEQKVTEFVFAH